jgi:hypothetical protein
MCESHSNEHAGPSPSLPPPLDDLPLFPDEPPLVGSGGSGKGVETFDFPGRSTARLLDHLPFGEPTGVWTRLRVGVPFETEQESASYLPANHALASVKVAVMGTSIWSLFIPTQYSSLSSDGLHQHPGKTDCHNAEHFLIPH